EVLPIARPSLMPRSDSQKKNELLKGTLDMLVLQTLSVRPLHGYAIAQQIEALSEDALRVEQGSLYPALERLQKKGWITSRWGESPTGRRARYYTITPAGRRQLGNEISSCDAMLVAINHVLRRAGGHESCRSAVRSGTGCGCSRGLASTSKSWPRKWSSSSAPKPANESTRRTARFQPSPRETQRAGASATRRTTEKRRG